MKKLSEFYNSLSFATKCILVLVGFCCLGPFVLVPIAIILNAGANERFDAVLNDPTEENVTVFLEKLGGITNHPDTWSKYRGLWNVVNRSNKVTTPTKEKLLAKLMSRGLYLNNTRVIDNYDDSYLYRNQVQGDIESATTMKYDA